MGGVNPRGAYAILKLWYRHVSARVPNPSRTDMEKVRGGFQILYQREYPDYPEPPLATQVNPAGLNNKFPSEAEVKATVQRLRPHRAGVHNYPCSEHFKQ